MKRPNALSLIGNTPLLELRRLWPGPGRLMAKAEFVQPGGSVKDRAALRIVEDAYATGALKPGQPVVEMTSGNMGAGLAVVCAVMGNPFYAVMSEGNSPERRRMMAALGAKVILVPQADGSPGQVTGADIARAEAEARSLAQAEGAFYADQFHNPSCHRAHEETTGPELWAQTGGRVDAFAACVGTGATLLGTAKALKKRNPALHCAAVEPAGAEVLAGKPLTKPRHVIQGTGYGAVPPQWEASLVDSYLAVEDGEVCEIKDRLAREEGLFTGFSSAANVAAALALLRSGWLPEGATVATVLCDTGLKYS